MSRWKPEFTAKDASITEDTLVFDGFFKMHLQQLQHARFDGGVVQIERELLKRGVAVGVLLFDPLRDELVLVEQFRVGALRDPSGPWLLELVAGIMDDPEESPEQVAIREALEETGVTLQKAFPIMRYYPSPGGLDEVIYLLYGFVDATHAQGIHGVASEGEDIKVHSIPVQDVFDLLDQGALVNAVTIIGVQWLKLNYTKIKEQGMKWFYESSKN